MSSWDQKSWNDITTMSGHITAQALQLAKRLNDGGESCTPHHVELLLDELQRTIEVARCPVQWAAE